MTPLRTLATVAFLGLAGVALAGAGGGAAGAADARPAKPKYVEYVALGDSWSADVVIANSDGPPDATYAPIDCAQSHKNYPKLVAAKLGIDHFKDATCGSATT